MLHGFGLLLGVCALLVVLFCTFYPSPRLSAFGRRLSAFGRQPVALDEPFFSWVVWCVVIYGFALSLFTFDNMTHTELAEFTLGFCFAFPLAVMSVLAPVGWLIGKYIDEPTQRWLESGDSPGRRAFTRTLDFVFLPIGAMLWCMEWISGAMHHRRTESALRETLRSLRARLTEEEETSEAWEAIAAYNADREDEHLAEIDRLEAALVLSQQSADSWESIAEIRRRVGRSRRLRLARSGRRAARALEEVTALRQTVGDQSRQLIRDEHTISVQADNIIQDRATVARLTEEVQHVTAVLDELGPAAFAVMARAALLVESLRETVRATHGRIQLLTPIVNQHGTTADRSAHFEALTLSEIDRPPEAAN